MEKCYIIFNIKLKNHIDMFLLIAHYLYFKASSNFLATTYDSHILALSLALIRIVIRLF